LACVVTSGEAGALRTGQRLLEVDVPRLETGRVGIGQIGRQQLRPLGAQLQRRGVRAECLIDEVCHAELRGGLRLEPANARIGPHFLKAFVHAAFLAFSDRSKAPVRQFGKRLPARRRRIADANALPATPGPRAGQVPNESIADFLIAGTEQSCGSAALLRDARPPQPGR